MVLNALNQNTNHLTFNENAFMTKMLGSNFGNQNNSESYYAKKGEPMYQKDMDSDNDGIVTFDEFKEYCKKNDISAKEMKNMLETRMSYMMTKNSSESDDKNDTKKVEPADYVFGDLDIIYAKDGDERYDAKIDTNKDSKVSYSEYLRYCQQNAKTEEKRSDTKVNEHEKSKFMTYSFGHAANAYNRNESETPKGRVEGKA